MKRRNLILLSIIVLLGCLWACEDELTARQKSEAYKRNHPSALRVKASVSDISPDNETLLIGYGTPFWIKIATYNLSTGEFKVLDAGENKVSNGMVYSPDGKSIAFVGERERDDGRNIFVMNADGSGLRQVTSNPKTGGDDAIYARFPCFSPDGRRIIFVRSERVRQRAFPLKGEMNFDWDVYEVDVDTGVERRLTNYHFYRIDAPYYLSDGRRFIFSGEGPYNPGGKGPQNYEEYESIYRENFIFIMDGRNNDLKPAFVNGSRSYRPSVSADDTVLFISRTTEMDGLPSGRDTQDLFLYKNGKIKRLTKLNDYIDIAQISRNGKLAYFWRKTGKGDTLHSEWLMRTDGAEMREIKIPSGLLQE